MPSDMTIVVADGARLAAIRNTMQLPGRALHFNASSVSAALESIRMNRPRLVAVDAVFAHTPAGIAFIDCVDTLANPQGDIRLIVHLEGRWVTAPRDGGAAAVKAPLPAAAPVVPAIVAPPAPVIAAPVPVGTRRAPRFLVRDAVNAVVESGSASLVDISVLGAQVVSRPVLRPSQKIKITLPDTGDLLHVTAHVAWSMFEKPMTDAYYRAGIEFTGAAQQALEDYRRRHCAAEPIPYRGR
jgi:hypothetical protein